MSEAYFGVLLDYVLKVGSLLSYVNIFSRFFTKKPRFSITDVSMTLTPREKREPRLDVDFKLWNGKSKLDKFRSSDALNVNVFVIPITVENEIIEASTSREPAGIIPVGRFHPSKHIMNIPKPVATVYIRVKCPETVLTKNLKLTKYLNK